MTYYMCYILWSYNVPFMRYNLLNLCDLYVPSKVKGIYVNWKIIYDFV